MHLLRKGEFVRLWVGQFLSLFADWALRALLLLWVFRLTHSGVSTSVVGLAEALPLLVLAPVAGALVDRWHRGRTMAAAVLARCALVLPLFLVTSRDQVPLLVAVTLLINVASQFFMPAAAAATPVVVGQEQLGQANSLLSLLQSTAGLVAPAAGALLFARLGPHEAVALLGLLYLCAAPVLASIAVPAPAEAERSVSSLGEDIVAGLSYVRQRVQLLGLFSTAFVYCLGVGALTVIDVVFISRVLHLRPETVSVLYLANGAGAFAGSTLLLVAGARLSRHYHHIVRWACLGNGAVLFVYALAPALSVAAAAVCSVGFLFSIALCAFLTLIQLNAEDRVMGRVMSLCNMTVAAGLLLSLAWGGALADLLGVRQVIATGAGFITLCGVLNFWLIRETPSLSGAGILDEAAGAVSAVPVAEMAPARIEA